MKQLIITLIIMIASSLSSCAGAKQQPATPSFPADNLTAPNGRQVVLTFIKHGSLAINYGDYRIQVDPCGQLPPVTHYDQFPPANLILVTHEHFDHFDTTAIAALTGPSTQVVLNARCQHMLGHGHAMANGDSLQLAPGVSLRAVPAYNTTPAHLKFHPRGRDNGYVLSLGGLRIYLAADTEDIPEMAALKGHVDVAFLPCNQPYTMTPAQLAHAARMIQPHILYPYHYGQTDVSQCIQLLQGSGIDVRIRPLQ